MCKHRFWSLVVALLGAALFAPMDGFALTGDSEPANIVSVAGKKLSLYGEGKKKVGTVSAKSVNAWIETKGALPIIEITESGKTFYKIKWEGQYYWVKPRQVRTDEALGRATDCKAGSQVAVGYTGTRGASSGCK